LRLVHQQATRWGLAADKIGLIGFSAGGRLAAGVLQAYDPEGRPDFVGFIYGGLWEEFPAPPDALPLFIAVADDDAWSAPPCVRLYQLWKEGGHLPKCTSMRRVGIGLACASKACQPTVGSNVLVSG
jgi:dienelactone hydrolase